LRLKLANMKIAIVLNTSWNIYNFRMNFIRALQAEGHDVHTIAPVDKYTPFLELAGCTHHNIKMDSRGANPLKDIALIVELGMVYRKLRPDVILHYTIKPNVYGTLAAAMLRIPVINNVCGLGTVFLKNNLTSAIAIGLYKLSFQFANKVFFQNHEDRELFLSKKLVSEESTDLLQGSGIDLNHFKPAAFNRNKKFTFLLISRLITDKGIFEYIAAINQLKSKGSDFKFQLMGAFDPEHKRGIKTDVINNWIQSGTVEYLGTTDDVRPFIHAADCIVLPSYREGTPRTLLEAASSAKPIIATDVPGCHQVVEHGVNGYLCRLKDSTDLANKMETMGQLNDEALIQFGVNGREKMETGYDEQLVINKYVTAIQSLQKTA
jgi:glycosyltransferase involved in cell wall biosynthesis